MASNTLYDNRKMQEIILKLTITALENGSVGKTMTALAEDLV